MRLEPLSQDQHDLYFDVLRSIRYHDRRAAYFDRLHKVTNALTILTAGIAIVDLGGSPIPRWLVWAVALTAAMATADLVIGFGRMADLHRNVRRRFGALEKRMVEAFPENGDVRTFEMERLDIQQDEPIVYRVLDILCHNETLVALGYRPEAHPDSFVWPPWWKRLSANWWPWHDNVSKPNPKKFA